MTKAQIAKSDKEITNAIHRAVGESNNEAVTCNHEGCKEIVSPEDDYYATPCGTFCDQHMKEHAKECGICEHEFDLKGANDE